MIIQKQHNIMCVFGFGSFFRGEPYLDIDILFVIKNGAEIDVDGVGGIYKMCRTLSVAIGVVIDCLVLTSAEFVGRPLINMNELVEIKRWPEDLIDIFEGNRIGLTSS